MLKKYTLIVCPNRKCMEIIGRSNKNIPEGKKVFVSDIDGIFTLTPIYSERCVRCNYKFLDEGKVWTQNGWKP